MTVCAGLVTLDVGDQKGGFRRVSPLTNLLRTEKTASSCAVQVFR